MLSQLSLKTYNLNKTIYAYERYINILKKNTDQTPFQTGEKILEGLKSVADEIKKKSNIMKNKDDSKRLYDELCKKYVNRMFWEDLERPLHKIVLEPSESALFNYIMKKGFQQTVNNQQPNQGATNTSQGGNEIKTGTNIDK